MKDQTVEMAKDWLTLLLAGLGISFQAHDFFGGLFLAWAAAALARRMSPEQDEREFWVVILGATLAAIVTAEVLSYWWPDVAPQMFMAAAGFLSRYAARFILRVAGLVEQRADKITDRVIDRVLPDEDDKK